VIQYYMQYCRLATLFSVGANVTFHETVRDTVGLSLSARKVQHLYAIQLSDIDPDSITR